jgi:putative ABC transport system permease protein
MVSIWHDLRYGLRMLGKNPGFTILAILTLALGIGAATLIGSVVDTVLLNPFPYKNADRLATPSISNGITRFPVPVFLDFKEQNHTFEDIGALAYFPVRYKGNGTPSQQVLGCWVTANTFELLGIKPFLGRQITQQDGNPGSPPAFAMSDTVWASLFNQDPKILGASLNLNGVPRTLVAIMPPRFRLGGCEVWIPPLLCTDLNRGRRAEGVNPLGPLEIL